MRALVAAVVLMTAACGSASGAGDVTVDDLDAVAERTALSPRTFVAEAGTGTARLAVAGTVLDAYRYEARVTADGVPFYEEVVNDDERYLRLLDGERFADRAGASDDVDALLAGGWVVDRTGAPAEFAGSDGPAVPLDPTLVTTVIAALDDLPELLTTGARVRRYDPDAVDYLPQDDRFPPHEDDGTRFDMLPEPFDPGSITVTFDTLEAFFLYASVWVDDGRVTRIEELMDLPARSDPQYRAMFEQIERGIGGAPSGLASFLELGTLDGLRLAESYRFEPAPSAAFTPPGDAVEVDLAEALEALRTGAAPTGIGALVPSDVAGLPTPSG